MEQGTPQHREETASKASENASRLLRLKIQLEHLHQLLVRPPEPPPPEERDLWEHLDGAEFMIVCLPGFSRAET